MQFHSLQKILAMTAVLFFILFSAHMSIANAGLRKDNKPAQKEYVFSYGTVKRSYLMDGASSKSTGAKRPLVLVLHGGGGNAENAVDMTRFSDYALKDGAIVVYPNGSNRRKMFDMLKTWNAGHCCSYAMEDNIDDVGFISSLIDYLLRTQNVDPNQVYVTGMSNGAMLAHRLGRELPDKIAAIAPVVGGLFGDEALPSAPVSALIINGGLDKRVPPDGGSLNVRAPDAGDSTPFKPAAYQSEYWAKANHCSQKAQHVNESKNIQKWVFDCPSNIDVVRYMIMDNGHAWPGGAKGSSRGDEPSHAIDASKVIWAFFKAHPKND